MSENQNHLLGITVLPEYFQYEGVDAVLDNCQKLAGATAITTSPYVMEPTTSEQGQREPPIDAGAGAVRLLDRNLWGKHELFVKTAPSFCANVSLYGNTCYSPPPATELTNSDKNVVSSVLDKIKHRGMDAYFQIQAAIPPGYRVQFSGVADKDVPRLPNGQMVENRVALNASLASEDIFQYQLALMIDLFQQYPSLDGIRIDWPEYPPYKLDSVFLDFNSAVATHESLDGQYDFDSIRQSINEVYTWLHGNVNSAELVKMSSLEGVCEVLASYGWLEALRSWLQMKKALVTSYIRRLREGIDAAGFASRKLVPHAFPPPFNHLSGLDYGEVGRYSDHIPVKMYTMHWAMIARFYLDQLTAKSPGIPHEQWIDVVFNLLEISDDPSPTNLDEVRYPGPDDPHLNTKFAQSRKFNTAQEAAKDTPIAALIHGYGPVDDFSDRFEHAFHAANRSGWINRYCYLSNEKLRKIGELKNR